MKTKNNVQQKILKSIAVVFSVALISFTVNAQGFLKSIYENNSFKDIALAMAEVTETPAPTNADLTSYDAEEYEEALEIEDWMINETSFGTFIPVEAASESPLELEDWMTDDSYFNTVTDAFMNEMDSELEIEDWMLDENLFNTRQENDHALELENWMFSEDIWNV
uniref:hypothetical protein n=1 Tax=uncultured Draconibacterium sp. TaxID=1573823 RepID=UPI0032173109